MNISRILMFFTVLALVAVVVPVPAPVQAESILPDGCLGNLNDNQVVVYYFHRKFDCQSCEVLEATLRPTLETAYADHFGTGRLAMCVINLDDPDNRHYLDQFEIFSSSVIIVKKKSGVISRYKNLDSIWDFYDNGEAISNLLQKEVSGFLSES